MRGMRIPRAAKAASRRLPWVCLASVLLLMTSGMIATDRAAGQSGGTVRGKISWCTGTGTYPAPNLRVALLTLDKARSSVSYSDTYGFYYFHDIPGGDYFLEVWSRGRDSNPLTYRIRVLSQPRTDVGPICLR